MNAHADMLIVVGYNGFNTPRGIFRSLALGYEILQDSKLPKQAPINAFYYVCQTDSSALRCKGIDFLSNTWFDSAK